MVFYWYYLTATFLTMTNIVCLIHGKIQAGQKKYSSLSIHYHTFFFLKYGPMGSTGTICIFCSSFTTKISIELGPYSAFILSTSSRKYIV